MEENTETKRPGRRSRPIHEQPGFKEAVEAAAAKVVGEMLADLKEGRAVHGTEDSASDPSWMRSLAMEISQLTDQGTGRKRVAPEIIRARAEAKKKMEQLIIAARAAGKFPTYQVRAKTLLSNRIVEPFWIDNHHTAQPTIIDWDGIPNDAMIPVNEVAKEIHAAYMESIGSVPRVVAEDNLAITSGGLVVHGNAAALSSGRRVVKEAPVPEIATGEPDGGLHIHHKASPGRFVEKHILGTIASPAQQAV